MVTQMQNGVTGLLSLTYSNEIVDFIITLSQVAEFAVEFLTAVGTFKSIHVFCPNDYFKFVEPWRLHIA